MVADDSSAMETLDCVVVGAGAYPPLSSIWRREAAVDFADSEVLTQVEEGRMVWLGRGKTVQLHPAVQILGHPR